MVKLRSKLSLAQITSPVTPKRAATSAVTTVSASDGRPAAVATAICAAILYAAGSGGALASSSERPRSLLSTVNVTRCRRVEMALSIFRSVCGCLDMTCV